MRGETVVATANVLRDLRAGDARRALEAVLAAGPDLVGLQEWELTRLPTLHRTGSVALTVLTGLRWRARGSAPAGRYIWNTAPLGGCAVGARADRYELLGCRSVLLSRPGRAEREDRPLGLEPPRLAAVGVYRDRARARRVTLISYHLASGVQRAGDYRQDRPLLGARHAGEVGALQRVVDARLALGDEVYAVGDSNFDGLRLSGLTSTWEGRDDHVGTHGSSRKIDDVHGPGPAISVTLLSSASDHRAVVSVRADPAAD